ncbi:MULTISPECIES: cell division protein ZapE [Dinoroseobacter]|jgi:cell division protein ZapE|nr:MULTISPECIES: cell division protein ZapE [Dinoroseobacter]MDD9717242.1 cell division protein ZapE [Dinoroseobacter sp. PD6]URF46839.1 cell division protein ZapE [Dinoroseobacter shibae]URF51150.1 cell division protein ZapE [Dinoroseobacter shibae]
MTDLIARYHALVADGEITADAAQVAALHVLEEVGAALAAPVPKRSFLKRFAKPQAPEGKRGAYLWGGVGRGKSMLMDLFFAAAPIAEKRRVHFHAFMQEMHAALHAARQTGVEDALAPVAADVARTTRLLCFDEMQITDITDAMLVGRLFDLLFADGVVIVTTSNRVPDDLYKNGLNRDLFLPFIETIKERLIVHELVSETDYRQNRLTGAQRYFALRGAEAREKLDAIWEDLTGGENHPLTLTVKGRAVEIPRYHNGVARMRFWELCGQPLGAGDYLALAGAVRVLMIDDIPQLGRSNFNEAKRFVTLIDALYEAKVQLICSAAAAPEMLYIEGEGTFEFERTASRLREMQDADWGRTD